MKRILIAIIAMMPTLSILAQSYNVDGSSVVFTKIYENTNLTISEAHDILEVYFATVYNDVNNTLN